MPSNPKSNLEKIQRILNAWQTLAPDKSFGGMTLAQFQAAVQPSLDSRQKIEVLEDQLTQTITDREAADETSLTRIKQVISGILADPTEGPDSALYEASGYTPDRDRKSGLTRKRKSKTTE